LKGQLEEQIAVFDKLVGEEVAVFNQKLKESDLGFMLA
jgi:hypothetical protein